MAVRSPMRVIVMGRSFASGGIERYCIRITRTCTIRGPESCSLCVPPVRFVALNSDAEEIDRGSRNPIQPYFQNSDQSINYSKLWIHCLRSSPWFDNLQTTYAFALPLSNISPTLIKNLLNTPRTSSDEWRSISSTQIGYICSICLANYAIRN